MTKEKWQGHLAILGTNLIFGLNTPIAKTIIPEWISPASLTLLRMGFTAVAFWIIATGVAYFLIPLSLKRIRPTTASMYNNLQPIVASSIAILIGQDVFSWDKPVAAALVFTGVYLVTGSKSREAKHI